MKDFLTYFFGVGTEVEFTNFSLAHFVPILLTILTIFLIYKNQDKIRDSKHEEKIIYFLDLPYKLHLPSLVKSLIMRAISLFYQ